MVDFRQKDIRKSEFIQQTAVDDSATFDFVLNGQNFKVTKADLVALFGTVGELIQKGELTGIPVLNKVGTVNEIRNIVANAGILASLSPLGGIQLDHNFIPGDAGSPILIKTGLSQPVIRNLIPGDGMSVAASGDNLVLSVSGVPAASNVVIVNEMADFPPAVGGVITLGDDSAYLVSANLSTSDRFVMGQNTMVYGADSAVARIEYTGTGVMFTQADPVSNYSKIKQLEIDCVNGTFFDVAGDGSAIFQLVDVTVKNCDICGTVADCIAMQITDCNFENMISDGITFSGSMGYFIAIRNLLTCNGGTMFDLGSSMFSLGFDFESGVAIIGVGATMLSGLAGSGNIDTGAFGSVFNLRIENSGTLLNNIDHTDDRWGFLGNDEIFDSINSILASHAGTTLVIAAPNTPVIIGATWVYDHQSRFSGTAGGRVTYTGKGAHVNVFTTLSAIGIIPTTRNYQFLLYKNGVAIPNAVFSRGFNNTGAGSVAILWQEDLATGDYLEIWVQNTDTADDLVLQSLTFGISG